MLAGLFDPLRLWIRSTWLYRQFLHGPVPDRIAFFPDDPRARSLEDADALMRGRFRFAGERVDIKEGSIFDRASPSDGFAACLHGFDWLRHVEAAGGDHARQFALTLAQQWLKRYARFTPLPWRPEIIAERLINLLSHGRFFLTNSDLVWRSRFFVSLRNQAHMLLRSIDEAPEGLPRLKSAAALTLSGLCLGDTRNTKAGLRCLSREIAAQILPDGGHISRSPETLLDAFCVLTMVQQTLANANQIPLPVLRNALDRMAHMIRFFRLGDGALAVFQGGNENDARTIEAALNRDEPQGKPLGHAPHSGYQRLALGRTILVLDAGPPAPAIHSSTAHAGCLAFEMSSGGHRLIVNCGKALGETEEWTLALRSTAAHSTLTLDDSSSASVLESRRLARVLGPRLVAGPRLVETRRSEGAHGVTIESTHDGYLSAYGLIHQRRISLGPRGMSLTGTDSLSAKELRGNLSKQREPKIPFAIRFHVHPDVRLSLAQGGRSVILKLPNGEGWRYRCSGGALAIEESIYFGGGMARRAEQLVVRAEWQGETCECTWLFEHVKSA